MLGTKMSLEEFSFAYLVSPKELIKKYEDDFGFNVSFKTTLSKSRLLNTSNEGIPVHYTDTDRNSVLVNNLLQEIKKYDLKFESLKLERVAEGSDEYIKTAMKVYQVLETRVGDVYRLNNTQHVDDLFTPNKNPINKICVVEILKQNDKIIGIDFIAKELSGAGWIRSNRSLAEAFDVDVKDVLLTSKNGRLQVIFKAEATLSVYDAVLNDIEYGVFKETSVPKVIVGRTAEDTLVYKDLNSKGIHIFGKTATGKSTYISSILESLKHLNPKDTFKVQILNGDNPDNQDITAKEAYDNLIEDVQYRRNSIKRLNSEDYNELPYLVFVLDEFRFWGSSGEVTLEYQDKFKYLLESLSMEEGLKLFFITSSFHQSNVTPKYLDNIGSVIDVRPDNTIAYFDIPKDIFQQYHALFTKERYSMLKEDNEFTAIRPIWDFKLYSDMYNRSKNM